MAVQHLSMFTYLHGIAMHRLSRKSFQNEHINNGHAASAAFRSLHETAMHQSLLKETAMHQSLVKDSWV